MKKLLLVFIFTFIASFTFSQEVNMINKSGNDIKEYVTKTYGNLDLITQNYSEQTVYIYITDNAQKLSYHLSNNKCTYQRIDYPTVKDGEDLIARLDTTLKRMVINIDVPDEYVWLEDIDGESYEWSVRIKNNGTLLIIKKNYTNLK